jgi:hypothetical protein
MVRNLRLSKIFWSITATFALLAALPGVLFKDIYVDVFAKEYLPGAYPQDVLTILVALSLFVLIATTKENDIRKQIIIIGLIGSLFYLYGIFTMERVYNSYYLLYAAVFASSFWSIIYSLSGFRSEKFSGMQINGTIVKTSAIASLVIAALFTFLWTSALVPLMREHNRIEYLYSIYILDLCFVMPAFVMLAVMSLRKLPFGILLTPAMMILGFFVIFPLGLNELAKPAFGMEINYGSMVISFVFSVFMLGLAVLQLSKVRFHRI